MRRRVVACALCLCALLSFAGLVCADAPAPTTAVIRNPHHEDRLNLRTKPSTGALSLGKYYSGVTVELLSGNQDGWYKVRIGPLTGYMDANYLVVNAAANSVVPAMPVVTIANSSGTGANLRTAQSTTSRSKGLYLNGTSVTVYGVAEEWLHVCMPDGQTGFIVADLVSPRPSFSSTEMGGSPSGNAAIVFNPNPQDRLNLRTRPSSDAPTLCKYYSGVVVTLLSDEQNGWYRVRIGNLEGYMKGEFLIRGGTQTTARISAMPQVTLNALAFLYDGMSLSSRINATLNQGEMVQVMGVSTDYLHVISAGGQTGFVLSGLTDPEIPFDLGK